MRKIVHMELIYKKKWEFGNKANLILGSSYQNEFYDDYGKDGHKSPDQVNVKKYLCCLWAI